MKNKNDFMTEELMNEKQGKKLKNRKKLKYGSIATGITAVVIVVVVLINILVGMLADVRLDLTKDKVYAVSEETIDYVKNLDQDVEIAISVEQDTIKDLLGTTEMMVTETLNKYEDYSDHISVTYFDTTKDPDILAKYQDIYGGDISSGCVIVASGERVKVYSILDMFDIDSNMYSYYMYGYCSFTDIITGYKGEQMLTNAIMNVTDANVKNVGIIELTGEADSESFIFSATQGNAYAMEALSSLLDDNGYDVERELNITTADFTTGEYDVLVLPAPVSDLSVDAVQRLSDFMYNDGEYGKHMIYVADYTQGDTPNLDAFLKEWNITISDSVVKETDEYLQSVTTVDSYNQGQYTLAPRITLATADYSASLENASLPIVAPFGRPIVEEKLNNGKVVIPLWQTSAGSTESLLLDSDITQEEADKAEAHTVACIVQNQVNVDGTIKESDMMVLTSMSMLDYYVLTDASYNNGEYVISALNTICGKEASTVIASKSVTAATIDITAEQIDTIKWVVWLVIPGLVVIAGIIVAIRRRSR